MHLKENTRETGNWGPRVQGILMGTIVSCLSYFGGPQVQNSPYKKIIESLITGAVAAVLMELVAQGKVLLSKIESLSNKHDSLEEKIHNDERIIFARPEHRRTSEFSIVGIEDVKPVPLPLPYKPQCGEEKWEQSFSLLRFDRIQDLLFSKDYLKHFFALVEKSNHKSRILIVNDIPRSRDAVRSFLQISKELKIHTYVYRKGELYGMLKSVRLLVANKKEGEQACEILDGNPELNLMVNDRAQFQQWASGNVTREADYVLRYVAASREVLTRGPGKLSQQGEMPYKRVACILRLMSAGIQDDREGLEAFEAILVGKQLPENFWSREKLMWLKTHFK